MKWRYGLTALVAAAVFVVAACSQQSRVKRVLPSVPMERNSKLYPFSELSDATLASITICNDSLGMDTRLAGGGRCLVCMPFRSSMGDGDALRHARALVALIGRAPHDTTYTGADCATMAYRIAQEAAPHDSHIEVELALLRLASRNDSVRAAGISGVDRLLDSLLAAGANADAERVLSLFANGVWERAERMLERAPNDELPLDDWERDAHRLGQGAPALRRLPPIPRTSNRLGVSEAEWAARLFDRLAALAPSDARRSAVHRLALTPWVAMRDWQSLDSAASAILARAPGDSAVLPARALAAYHRVRNPVRDFPRVMASFDTALRAMPRPDSLLYDSFDDLLRQDDDEWRYGFLPSDRLQLDQRGWAVLDPIWSTAVNEIRLAKRARHAEANYRYAHIAPPGVSGSETAAGQMLTRRGAPDSTWTIANSYSRAGPRYRADQFGVELGWPGVTAARPVERWPDFWRAAYKQQFSHDRIALWFVNESDERCELKAAIRTVRDCVRAARAEWSDVPFWGTTDTIDVAVARFRAGKDSTDLYVAGRLPLRRFKFRDGMGSVKSDSIDFTLFLASALGEPVYQAMERRALPPEGLVAWTTQWTPRTDARTLMHRVEALEASRPAAARGAVFHTSDAAVSMPLRGFGISDLIVAASAREKRSPARRWTDMTFEPNAAVVAPGQKFTIGWELYDLTPAPDGRVRWRVSIRRENGAILRRTDTRGMLTGERSAGDRVLADEPEAPAVMYNRDETHAPALFEHLTFNMGAFPPGRHVVEVRIDDLVAKRSVTRSVMVRVLDANAQKRTAYRPPSSPR